MEILLSITRLPQTSMRGRFGRKDLRGKRSYAGSIKGLVVIAANGSGISAVVAFNNQKLKI